MKQPFAEHFILKQKHNMKKILLLLFIPLVLGCEIEYDGNTKIVVKGTIVDENNNPIPNKEVNLYVSRDAAAIVPFIFYVPSETNFIGKTTTDNFGKYVMIIPQPKNFSEIIVETNNDDNLLNRKQFRNINLSSFTNYLIELPITKLYLKSSLTTLNVTVNNVDPNIELLKLEYIGNIPNEIELINPYDHINLNFITYLNVLKNQTITLKYTVFNYLNQTTSILQQEITIDNSNQVNYTLNY
jgi:hypothetical protein